MISVPRDATNEQVLGIVRGWIDLLAAEDYQAAFDAIGSWGIHGDWTPEFIRDDIKNYRSPQFYPGVEDFRVTDWRTAQGGNPEAEQKVLWFEPNASGLAGAVAFDLPLNGRWSSLTADFVLWKNGDAEDCYTLGLEEMTSWQQRAEEDEAANAEPSAA